MKNQHTPGPWAVSPYNNITSRNGTVAKTEQMPGNDDAERKANATLISAATDLLSALREAVECLSLHGNPGVQFSNEAVQVLIESARAAIAKAEGAK